MCESCGDGFGKVKSADIDTTVNYDEDAYGENFERLYNFSKEQVDDGVIAYASSGGSADEISVVHVADSSDVNGIKNIWKPDWRNVCRIFKTTSRRKYQN